VYHLNKQE